MTSAIYTPGSYYLRTRRRKLAKEVLEKRKCNLRYISGTRHLAPLCRVIRLRLQKGISLILEHRNKKVNDIHEGKWNGLGGKFEAGETPEGCVIREVLE